MNDENVSERQVETALEQATKQRNLGEDARRRELLKLTGGLRKVSFYLSDQEYHKLCSCVGAGTLETFFESFAADLLGSERSIWKGCQARAEEWHAAHLRAERATQACLDQLDTEGGCDEC